MSNSNSSSPPQFDVATAALEHLELLNRSNVNPLEVAAQFRTLLRSKKARGNNANNKNDNSPPPSSNIDYTYMDYLAADATHRRRARSRGRSDRRSKSLGRIKYDLDEDDDTNNQSGYSHFTQDQSSSNYDPEQSHLRNTIDDTNIYYATSARHGGLITTTNNNSARQYLPESHSCFGLSKWHDEGDSSTEDIYADSAVGSDYSEPPPHLAFASSKAVSCDSAISGTSSHKQYSSSSSEQNQGTPPSSSSLLISPTKQYFANLSQIDESSEQTTTFDRSISSSTADNPYPTINWKQLREKQHGHSLDKAKTFVTTTLPRKTISSQVVKPPPPNLNTSSPISLLNYHKNQPNFRKRIEQFSTTATNRPSRPRAVTTDLSQALQSSTTMTTSSLTTVSAMSIRTPSDTTESFTYPNVSELRKNFEQKSQKKIPKPIDITTTSTASTPPLESPLSSAPSIISTGDSRSSSSSSSSSSVCKSRCSSSSRSSNEIRTPSISPTNSPRPSYTISRLNASSMNNEDVFFPIADCNLVIKHKASGGPKRTGHYNRRPSSPHPHPHPHSDNSNNLSNSMYSISSGYTEEAHLSGVCNENELMGGSTDDAVYV